MKSSTIRRSSITHYEKIVIEIAAWLAIFGIACVFAGVIF
jgi:hypothetical protein